MIIKSTYQSDTVAGILFKFQPAIKTIEDLYHVVSLHDP